MIDTQAGLAGLSLGLVLLLFGAALLAGFLDTLAGGGGLITLPALMLAGLPPLTALGVNKLQGSVGTATASLMMWRKGKLRGRAVGGLMAAAFAGSVAGSVAIQFVDQQQLRWVIPTVLGLIVAWFLLAPAVRLRGGAARIGALPYRQLVVPLIGAYDGAFGPGTGSFFSLAGVALRGHGLLDSTAIAKPLNFATNVSALAVFLAAGHILWPVGLLMMLGQVIGAWLGAHSLLRIDPRWLRLIVVAMSGLMLIAYLL